MFVNSQTIHSSQNQKKTIGDLLNAHRASKRKRDDQSDQTIKEAVLSLISRHQNVDDLIAEATRIQRNHTEGSAFIVTVDGLYFALKSQAETTNSSLSSLTASLCCTKLSAILKSKPADTLLFSEDERALVIVLIGLIKKVQQYHGFNRNNFIKTLNKDNSLPVELVWRLHQDDIMTYFAYITCNLGRPNVIGAFPQAVTRTCFCDPTCPSLSQRKLIVKDIMTFLVGQGYTESPTEGTTSKGMKKVSTALLDSITKKLLAEDPTPPAICLHEMVMTPSSLLEVSVLQRYANRQITIILSHNPQLKVSDAIRQQNDWTFAKTPSFMTDMYKHLLLVFSADEVIRLVALTLEQQEVNWRTVLSFVATFLVVFSDASRLLQELVSSLLQKAFDRCEMDSLILAFLLARQGALEGPHVFPSYADWFQKTFGDSARSSAMNKKSFGFLIKFLTDLVPYEEAQMLKAHVLRPPALPAKCHPLLADYIVLAKTRLEDLKMPLETTNMYDEGQSSVDKEKVLKQAEKDVNKALSGFEKTGKVPASVMESSIFRKPYFIGRFLPALLKPRPLPDVPDIKMRFIDALNRADKIPSSMYNTYEKACRKESSHLLEGIMSDEDESMEDMLLPPREQFENALSILSEAVIKVHSEQKAKTGVASQVSILSQKIAAVLDTDPLTAPCKGIILDVTTPAFTKELTEMAASVIQVICKVSLGLSETTSQQGAWLRQLLAMLSRHTMLWSALLYQLWMLVTLQGYSLKRCHIYGLSATLIHLTSDSTLSSNVTLKTPNREGPYTDLLVQCIPRHTKRWMDFSLRFYASYLDQAFRTFTDFSLFPDIPQQAVMSPHVIKQFQYLVNRLYPEARLTEDPDPALLGEDPTLYLTLCRSDQFRRLQPDVPMSFSEWVSVEIKVHCHDDPLSSWQRSDYSQWFIQQNIGESYQNCPDICRTIAHAILDQDLRYEEEDKKHPSCTCPQTSARPGGDSRDHLVVLLQSLLPLLPPDVSMKNQDRENSDITEAVPWLRDVWREREQKLEADEYSVQRHAETVAFLRLSRLLYPAFYFVRGK